MISFFKKDKSLDYLLGSICTTNVNYQKQPLKIPGFSESTIIEDFYNKNDIEKKDGLGFI